MTDFAAFSRQDGQKIASVTKYWYNKLPDLPRGRWGYQEQVFSGGATITPVGVLTSGSTIENGIVTVMVQRLKIDYDAGTESNDGDPVKVYLPFYGTSVTAFDDTEHGIATGDRIDTLFQDGGKWVCAHCIGTFDKVLQVFEDCDDPPQEF